MATLYYLLSVLCASVGAFLFSSEAIEAYRRGDLLGVKLIFTVIISSIWLFCVFSAIKFFGGK